MSNKTERLTTQLVVVDGALCVKEIGLERGDLLPQDQEVFNEEELAIDF